MNQQEAKENVGKYVSLKWRGGNQTGTIEGITEDGRILLRGGVGVWVHDVIEWSVLR